MLGTLAKTLFMQFVLEPKMQELINKCIYNGHTWDWFVDSCPSPLERRCSQSLLASPLTALRSRTHLSTQ